MDSLIDIATVGWEDLKRYIYNVDGSLRDIYVLDATREDWRIWSDLVNTNYPVRFLDEHLLPHDRILFAEMLKCWDGGVYLLHATFVVGDMEVKCHFFNDEEIENDIDPKQINSYAAHLQLLNYMTLLSQALGKRVLLTPENIKPASNTNNRAHSPLLAVDQHQQQVNAYWLSSSPH
jgi:hypothetical protein